MNEEYLAAALRYALCVAQPGADAFLQRAQD